MAVSYGAAVSADAPAVVDTEATQDTGAVCQGIGITGADGDTVSGAYRIGGAAATTDILIEYGDGVGV
jgi:hypothetical protein